MYQNALIKQTFPWIQVVTLLEKLNVPYTGANAEFYDPSRLEMKKVAMSKGFKAPAWFDVKVGNYYLPVAIFLHLAVYYFLFFTVFLLFISRLWLTWTHCWKILTSL